MFEEEFATAGAEIAGDVQLEGDLAFGEYLDEVRVELSGEGVADALGADVESSPDALRAAGFAGVAEEMEAILFGFGVEFAEVLGGAACFVAADADAYDAGVLVLQLGGLLEGAGTFFNAEMADRVDDPEQRDVEVAFGAGAA